MKTLPDHFFVSSSDGGLYDTRKPNWINSPPLRHNYANFGRIIEDSIALRAAIRQRYSWPGGYELLFIASDGGILCGNCARQEYRQIAYSLRHKINDEWSVVALTNSVEIEGLTLCDHCGEIVVDEEDCLS